MSEDIAKQLQGAVRRLGREFNPEVLRATQDLYRPFLDNREGTVKRDQSYGSHERHRLDVYLPADAPRGVVTFVHGGGFIGGDKNADGFFYANIGRFLQRNGYIAVLPNYRLAPGSTWPAGAHDVRDAVRWARANLNGGSTPDLPLFVIGQSAGASHVASWLFDSAQRGEPIGPVSGVMLMSGFYLAKAPLTPHAASYFGTDATLYEERSPLTHVAATQIPIWLSIAELDPAPLAAPTLQLAHAITLANKAAPRVTWFEAHNHVSTVLSIGTPQEDVAQYILSFLAAPSSSENAAAT